MSPIRLAAAAALSVIVAGSPATAQMAAPGAPDISRVAAGTYAADPAHSQIAWSLNHFGFTTYDGLFGGAMGTLTLDPAHPATAMVAITVPIAGLVTTVPALNDHLKSPDFFDAAKFPTATFTSTAVTIRGTQARIVGTLMLHGISRPVTLDARFVGAGVNPLTKKATVGFAATATVKRSDFGMTAYLPALGDEVALHINAAFERAN